MGERQTLGEMRLTPRAKRVIQLSVDEAHRLGHSYIGTEHLLLGLVRERGGVAVRVLESLGATPEKIRSAVEKELGKS
jgi:ATP-dependent Clp protease ATP-binding subunit ClpC